MPARSTSAIENAYQLMQSSARETHVGQVLDIIEITDALRPRPQHILTRLSDSSASVDSSARVIETPARAELERSP